MTGVNVPTEGEFQNLVQEVQGDETTLNALVAASGASHFDPSALQAQLAQDEAAATASQTSYMADKSAMKAQQTTDENVIANLMAQVAAITGTSTPGNFSEPGEIYYDTDSRLKSFANINKWNAQFAANAPRQAIKFGLGPYTPDVALDYRSGTTLLAADSPVREFGTRTVFHLANADLFRWIANSQGYPSDGSPRDVNVKGIQFLFGDNYSPLPQVDPKAGGYKGKTSWCVDFHECGFVGSGPVALGFGDGLTVTGKTHVQGSKVSPFKFGGSECKLDGQGISLMDSSDATWATASLPFVEMLCDKWQLQGWMITMRGNSYGLLVSGGGEGHVSDMFWDCSESSITKGPAVVIAAASDLALSDSNYHENHGVHVIGGSAEISIDNETFYKCPEVLTIEAAFTGVVLLGAMNKFPGSARTVKVAKLSQIVCYDRRVTVKDFSGKVLQAATA